MAADTIHASVVAHNGKACLIRGASGSGKSTLALDLIALGCHLVTDDQALLSVESGELLAAPPAVLAGLIEARGVGLIRMPYRSPVAVALVVDLDHPQTERVPETRTCNLQGISCPVIYGKGHYGLASIVHAVLRYRLDLCT